MATTSRTTALGRSVIQRGGYSLYLSIDREWLAACDTPVDAVVRLERVEFEEGLLRLRLHIDRDYAEVSRPPGDWDINFVDINTGLQWAIPSGVRRLHGIDEEFIYNMEFNSSESVVDYDIVSPSQREELLVK